MLSQPNLTSTFRILASSLFSIMGPAAACLQAQAGQHSRLQHDSSVTPAPVRYVNYLAYEGYSVEIIGGKHFKTPDGEFVEIKSGTQYKIHVKNSRAYGKGTIKNFTVRTAQRVVKNK